jgi:hypothetical protein
MIETLYESLEIENDARIVDAHYRITDYRLAEQSLLKLLKTENLDQKRLSLPDVSQALEQIEGAVETAIATAYQPSITGLVAPVDAAHRFLQRILYHINRLNFFWYRDLNEYENERSPYLQNLRDRIETPWQAWETQQFDQALMAQFQTSLAQMRTWSVDQVKQALQERADADLQPPLSPSKRYIREGMTKAGYRHLIAIASLDGLVESSRLCHILGGASNEIQATLIRVLLEEYGNGRLSRKHSTFYAQMMEELGLNSQPEAYFEIVPWEVLACINHNFLLTERKRHFLRYNGGFTYFEIYGPSIYQDYMMAAQRLGLSDTAMGYWELHIREDERHGQWMLHQVAFALADTYPNEAWELVWGYDQEKWLGDRAGTAVMRAVQAVEQCC